MKFGDNVFSAYGYLLYYKVSELRVKYKRRSGVIQHIKTKKKQERLNREKYSRQVSNKLLHKLYD